MAVGRKTGGRQKGSLNKSTIERDVGRQEIEAEAFSSLTEEQIRLVTPRDMFRLVAQTALRQRNMALVLKAAADWAPYEHAKLAPLIVEPPAEPEEAKAKRLHDAMKAMEATVGGEKPE